MDEKLPETEELYICVKCGHEVKERKYTKKIPECPKCGGTMKRVVVLK